MFLLTQVQKSCTVTILNVGRFLQYCCQYRLSRFPSPSPTPFPPHPPCGPSHPSLSTHHRACLSSVSAHDSQSEAVRALAPQSPILSKLTPWDWLGCLCGFFKFKQRSRKTVVIKQTSRRSCWVCPRASRARSGCCKGREKRRSRGNGAPIQQLRLRGPQDRR